MREKSLDKHEEWKGKIEVVSRCKIENKEELAIAYTPGVSYPCEEIEKDPINSYKYTRRGNLVGVITDGSAVLGMGNIGPLASMPVMEGKCILFKEFADIDAFPICINEESSEKIIEIIKSIEGSFGAINLEDISAPRCFEIERKLNEICDIPVFHDDQHGTAIAVLAGLINALKVVNKDNNVNIVVNGAGAAGIAIANLIYKYGYSNIVVCDRYGIITNENSMNKYQLEAAIKFNKGKSGTMEEALKDSDVFIGVSAANILSKKMINGMKEDAIIFALANPTPEIMPSLALEFGARIVATGRSDFKNQINNLLVFPGIIKGALKGKINKITKEIQIEVAKGIANYIDEKDLNEENIIPNIFDKKVVEVVSEIVCNFYK